MVFKKWLKLREGNAFIPMSPKKSVDFQLQVNDRYVVFRAKSDNAKMAVSSLPLDGWQKLSNYAFMTERRLAHKMAEELMKQGFTFAGHDFDFRSYE